jgi:hypothetical protein
MSELNQRIEVTKKWVEKFEHELDHLESRDISTMTETERFFHRLQLDAFIAQLSTLNDELVGILSDTGKTGQ